MANTYTPNIGLARPSLGDTGWATPVNGNASIIDALATVGPLAVTTTETPSSTLNVKVAAGTMVSSAGRMITYAGAASQAIPTGTSKYLYLTDAGVLTLGAAWPANPTAFVPLAVVTAGATSISTITDSRVVFRSVTQ